MQGESCIICEAEALCFSPDAAEAVITAHYRQAVLSMKLHLYHVKSSLCHLIAAAAMVEVF